MMIKKQKYKKQKAFTTETHQNKHNDTHCCTWYTHTHQHTWTHINNLNNNDAEIEEIPSLVYEETTKINN